MWKWMVYVLMGDGKSVSILVSHYGFATAEDAQKHLKDEGGNIQCFVDENEAQGIIEAYVVWELQKPDNKRSNGHNGVRS